MGGDFQPKDVSFFLPSRANMALSMRLPLRPSRVKSANCTPRANRRQTHGRMPRDETCGYSLDHAFSRQKFEATPRRAKLFV